MNLFSRFQVYQNNCEMTLHTNINFIFIYLRISMAQNDPKCVAFVKIGKCIPSLHYDSSAYMPYILNYITYVGG